jgi:hypothetical protein
VQNDETGTVILLKSKDLRAGIAVRRRSPDPLL